MPTSDRDGGSNKISDLMQEIKVFLKTGLKEEIGEPQLLIKYYWEASRKADQLIRMALGEDGGFPVDIERLARELGVQIEEEDLNQLSGWKSMNRKIGQVEIGKNWFTNRERKIIFVDIAAPPSSRRYAIAHELVHYIMHYNDRNYYEDYCIMPMCPMDIEEIVADIFSIFLLIPVRYFFFEFLKYVERSMDEEKTPVTTERWIRYLAERSMISDYYVAYGYQQLRYVAYWIYQAWKKDDATEDNEDREDRGNNGDKKGDEGTGSGNTYVMTDADREQVKKETEDYYTPEMGEKLFGAGVIILQ